MKAQHINITLPISLKRKVDAESAREHIGRSTLIQKALGFYLEAVKQKRMRTLLAEGYAEMADETIVISKDFDSLDREALRYVD